MDKEQLYAIIGILLIIIFSYLFNKAAAWMIGPKSKKIDDGNGHKASQTDKKDDREWLKTLRARRDKIQADGKVAFLAGKTYKDSPYHEDNSEDYDPWEQLQFQHGYFDAFEERNQKNGG